MMAPQQKPQPAQATVPDFVLTASPAEGNRSPDHGKSQCSSMSDAESFEGFGDVDMDAGSTGSPAASLSRNTWLRTSLRRTPPSHQENLPNRRWGSFRHSGKRLGSNALASQLYRSSSFNSSGRSSTCDTVDDVYSDASLEDDVLDLNHKVQMLQQQVSVLADHQTGANERYTRAKQDSAALQARVHMLEEQLRESEIRAEERLQEERKRHKELITRVEREKYLEIENCNFRLHALESENSNFREEAGRLRSLVDNIREEKVLLEEQLHEAESRLSTITEEHHQLKDSVRLLKEMKEKERVAENQLVEELNKEIERLKAEMPNPELNPNSRLTELQEQVLVLRQENKSLQEVNEEIQAQLLTRSLEEGRNLLTGHSLAAEFEAMNHNELRDFQADVNLEQMRTALKEQQEVNGQLRSYIDGILLNIVENYPQLLEVKTQSN